MNTNPSLINYFLQSRETLNHSRKDILTNQICLIFFLGAAPFFFIFSYLGLHTQAYVVLAILASLTTAVLLNIADKHTSAKLLFMLTVGIGDLYYATTFGPEAGIHLNLFALVSAPLVLYEYETDKKILAFSYLLPIAIFFYLEFSNYSLFGRVPLEPLTNALIYNIVAAVTFLISTLTIRFYYTLNRKSQEQLEESNSELVEAYIELEKKKKLDAELEAAREIQLSILPEHKPHMEAFHFDHLFIPASVVGGDYFDFLVFSNHKVGFIVADIVGKGIPASLMMIALKHVIHNSIQKDDSPSEAMAKLNPIIYHHNTLKKYVPMFYGVLDTKTNEFSYCNAGHEPGLLLQSNNALELDVGGVPLGMMEYSKYDEDSIEISTHDRILLMTDGLTDIKNENGKRFGFQNMMNLFLKFNGENGTFISKIQEALWTFKEEAHQADDITLISIRKEHKNPVSKELKQKTFNELFKEQH